MKSKLSHLIIQMAVVFDMEQPTYEDVNGIPMSIIWLVNLI